MTAIHLGRRLPGASSNLPGRPDPDTDPEIAPAPSLFVLLPVGLPCRFRCRKRGARLPHRFTLASPSREAAVYFSVALSLEFAALARGLLPPDVIRHRMSMEPGLSSQGDLSALPQAAVRPTDDMELGAFPEEIKQPRYRVNKRRSVSMVDGSASPSTRSGRKWRWNAVTTLRVLSS